VSMGLTKGFEAQCSKVFFKDRSGDFHPDDKQTKTITLPLATHTHRVKISTL
jgi:hypothetical protein